MNQNQNEQLFSLIGLVSEDGYLFGTTDDTYNGSYKSYWKCSVDRKHLKESKLVEFENVPKSLAVKLCEHGTSEQWFSDGYEAYQHVKEYISYVHENK